MYKYKRQAVTRRHDQELSTVLWGYIVIAVSVAVLLVGLYSMVFSKIIPYTGNVVLDWVKEDYYFGPLLFTMIPVSVIFVYLNWLSLKFFRHN